jgi:hypothetical protein
VAGSRGAWRGLDLPILLIAVLVATMVTILVGSRVTVGRCRDAGGQLRVSGMDQVCVRADGSTVVMAPLLTATGWTVGVGLWLVLTAGAYGGMRSYLRARPS